MIQEEGCRGRVGNGIGRQVLTPQGARPATHEDWEPLHVDLAVDVDLDLEFDGFGPRPGLGDGHRDLLKVWWISIQLGLFSKQLLMRLWRTR